MGGAHACTDAQRKAHHTHVQVVRDGCRHVPDRSNDSRKAVKNGQPTSAEQRNACRWSVCKGAAVEVSSVLTVREIAALTLKKDS